MMKSFFLFLLAISTSVSAFADFVPGRVRVNSITNVEIYSSTGIYDGMRSGELSEMITDGSSKVVYIVNLEKQRELLSFDVVSTDKSSCGNKIKAVSQDLPGAKMHSELELVDMRNALCDLYVKDLYSFTMKTTNLVTGEISTVNMGGNPTFFMHTM